MVEFIAQFPPVTQALFATLFTWGVTALGAAGVFLAKDINQKVLDWLLGFAGGVMIAASFWSLLAPGIELAEEMGMIPYVPAIVGFLSGGVFLWLLDQLLPHLHINAPMEDVEGTTFRRERDREKLAKRWQRSILLVTAITLHNIPEGLAVGVAFGAAAAGLEGATVGAAVALGIGIGLQNFPEGVAVAMPLRREGLKQWPAFMWGQASGMVEPIAGVIGAIAALLMRPLLPYALAFAAGAMIYVVTEEVIPESQAEGNTDLAVWGVMIGFTVMMALDVALG